MILRHAETLDVADGFLDQVRASFERLASLPLLGSVRAFRAEQLEGIRTA
ncbi:MAG: hypothetical protein IPF82_24050 [Blastocatellia bacterium]|nr:hypothetical protein [Blastocatellia bacterium]